MSLAEAIGAGLAAAGLYWLGMVYGDYYRPFSGRKNEGERDA